MIKVSPDGNNILRLCAIWPHSDAKRQTSGVAAGRPLFKKTLWNDSL